MANQGLIKQTTLEAATEGVQVITKAFWRTVNEEAVQNGWFVDVTNDTFAFMRPDRDFKGFVFGAGGNDTWDMGLKRLGTELMGFRNYPDDDDQVDFRVRELQASRIPHANVEAWGAVGDGSTDDRSAISNALTELKTAGGGELFLPPGTFRMSTGISESDLKGITIRGAGITATTLKLDDVAVRHFIFTAAEGITFKDLTFQGAGSTTASNAGGGVNMPLGAKSFNEGHRFENVQFLSLSETAIEIPTSRGLVLSNVKVDDCNLDMIDLTSPFATVIDSLLMTNGQQRGLYIHGGGKDVSVAGSRAYQCGIGYEVDAAGVLFNGCTADEGQNRSASFPGYGFVAGDTNSLVALVNTCVLSTAGITPYVENTGSEFAKFNARNVMAGVTTTENTGGVFSSPLEVSSITSPTATKWTIPDTPLQITGYAGGASDNFAVRIDGSAKPDPSLNAYGIKLQSDFTEAASGTHGLFATASIGAPVITGGGAALTSVAALYLPDTTTGGATNNYSIYAPGTSQAYLGGDLAVVGDLSVSSGDIASVASTAFISAVGGTNTAKVTSFDVIQDATFAYLYQRANRPLLIGTNNAEVARFSAAGLFGLNVSPTAQLHVVSGDTARVGMIVDTAASATADVQQWKANGTERADLNFAGDSFFRLIDFDNDAGNGPRIIIGRNTDASTPAAGHIWMTDKGATPYFIWPEDNGDLRIGTTTPTFANDASGTVVGTQTSWHEVKDNINDWDGAGALQRIIDTDLYSFQFKECGQRGDKLMHGFVIYDRDAWYAMNTADNQIPALDEAEILGTLTAAVQHLAADVAELKGEGK
jgi:hypothetical protein